MKEQPTNNRNRTSKRPTPRGDRLHLPFDNRKKDSMSWIYDKRLGLCITLVALIVWAIVSISAKIETLVVNVPDTIYIDMNNVEVEEPKPEIRPQEVEEKEESSTSGTNWSEVRNVASNENGEVEDIRALDRELTQQRKELEQQGQAAMDEVAEGDRVHEEHLGEIDAMVMEQRRANEEDRQKRLREINVKREGNVTVSCSFTDPVRYASHLEVPAYRCESGGEVVVSVELDQSGKVVSATVIRGGDESMQRVAKEAAYGSTFDVNPNAPRRQKGTITYIFIPQ